MVKHKKKPPRKAKAKQPRSKKKVKRTFRISWKNLKISRKYITIYILSALLFAVAGGLVYLQLHEGQKNIKALDKHNEQVNHMSQMTSIVQLKDVQIADYLLTGKEKYIEAFEKYQESFNTYSDKLEPTLQTEEEKKIFAKIKEYDKKFNDMFTDDILGAMEVNQDTLAMFSREKLSAVRVTMIDLDDDVMDIISDNQQTAVTDANHSIDYSIIVLAVFIVIAIIVGIFAMFFISKSIAKNLNKIDLFSKGIATGDLTGKPMDYN